MSYTTTTTSAPRGNYIVKFTVDEFVFDLQARIWRVIAIKNLTTNPIFTCENVVTDDFNDKNLVQVKDFYEDELVKMAESTGYFNSLMNYKIEYYEEMLAKITAAKTRIGG